MTAILVLEPASRVMLMITTTPCCISGISSSNRRLTKPRRGSRKRDQRSAERLLHDLGDKHLYMVADVEVFARDLLRLLEVDLARAGIDKDILVLRGRSYRRSR